MIVHTLACGCQLIYRDRDLPIELGPICQKAETALVVWQASARIARWDDYGDDSSSVFEDEAAYYSHFPQVMMD